MEASTVIFPGASAICVAKAAPAAAPALSLPFLSGSCCDGFKPASRGSVAGTVGGVTDKACRIINTIEKCARERTRIRIRVRDGGPPGVARWSIREKRARLRCPFCEERD